MARGTVRVTKIPTSIDTRTARTCADSRERMRPWLRSLRSARRRRPAPCGAAPDSRSLNSRSEVLGTVTSRAQHSGEAVGDSHRRCRVRMKQAQPGTHGTEGSGTGRGTGAGVGVEVGVGSGWSQPGSWAEPPL
ncbi:MAG: hypothetical protein JWM45_3511 [Pseudonocardiales bacterium]|nr:hypothetical protein [Pseudonocardiales bacterium]